MIARLSPRGLALAVLLWTLVAWGGRVSLLAPGEADAATWLRIGGSLLTGLLGAVGLWQLGEEGRRLAAVWVWTYTAWTTVVWTTSLWSVWTADHPLSFQLVHTVLAVVSIDLAAVAALVAAHRVKAAGVARELP